MSLRHVRFASSILALSTVLASCGSGGSGPTNVPNTTVTGSVKGTVVDNTGAGVASAAVQLSAAGQTTRNTTTSSTGSYTFESVATGLWQVNVSPPIGYGSGPVQTVTVSANAEATAPAVVLPKVAVGPAPQNADVSITQQAVFSPQAVLVARGGTVRFTNNDVTTHTATATSFDTGLLAPGASSSKTFATAGTFNYICTLHAGMTGSITVQ
ncbi:MAG TPA: carboxypeptidase regulatory-like domain-containing protein [Longimicrobiales bacterium]|nr:carboxypeptidase regulatory-like domain-containing protein [Longimicrobiales bacterium]